MDLQKFALKLYAEPTGVVDLLACIPIFHRWIRMRAIEGLLIDVADYTHVHHGPGVMLITHEGDYSLDGGDGRLGLLYTRKHGTEASLDERLERAFAALLRACRQLESEPEIAGHVRFRGDALAFCANDRLLAPNGQETHDALAPVLGKLADRMYGGQAWRMSRPEGAGERFTVAVEALQPTSLHAIAERLGIP